MTTATDGLTTLLEPRTLPNFVETASIQGVVDRALTYPAAGFPLHPGGASATEKTTLAMHVAGKQMPDVNDAIRLGRLVKTCLDRRRDRYRERMMSILRPLADDLTSNVLLSDEMVMNVAFLVDQSRERYFDERVHALDDMFENEIRFRVIRSLPPYSFSTVAVTEITREQVEEARRALGLNEGAPESRSGGLTAVWRPRRMPSPGYPSRMTWDGSRERCPSSRRPWREK